MVVPAAAVEQASNLEKSKKAPMLHRSLRRCPNILGRYSFKEFGSDVFLGDLRLR